jgi:hypothetical protein
MYPESKIFVFKRIKITGQISLREIIFVCREKEHYQSDGFGFWWQKQYGLRIKNSNKQIKYFMFGFTFFDIKIWLDFKWIS